MKKAFKVLLFSIMLIALGFMFPTEVSAKIISQDNLKVRFEVDNLNDASDEFKGKVIITNIGIRDMNNIDIDLKIPKGVKIINEKDIIKKISELNAGESAVFDFQYKLDKESKPDNEEGGETEEEGNKPPTNGDQDNQSDDDKPSDEGDSDKPSDGDTTDKPNIDEENNEGSNEEDKPSIEDNTNGDNNGNNKPSIDNDKDSDSGNVNKPSTDNNSNSTGKPSTGDKNNLIVLVVIAIICIILMILVFRNNKKDRKKILSIFMIITFILPLFNDAVAVQAIEETKKTLNIKESIEINKEVYEFELIVNYNAAKETVIPSGSNITRGEWISKLVNTLGIKEYQEIHRDSIDEIEIESDLDLESFKDPFTDIKGNKYEEDIMYGFVNSFLDITEGDFRPDDFATREFATLTAVKALSFQATEDSLTYDDINEVTHKKEISLAISLGLINLENNKFNPNRTLTSSEGEYILEGFKGVLRSQEVDENYDNEIKFKDEVIKVGQEAKFEVNGTKIIFEYDESLKDFKVGDILLLPTEVPYKITNVTKEENKLILDTEEPKIEETVEYVDIQGNAKVDTSKFIPAEGVEIVESPEARIDIDEEGEIDGVDLVSVKFKTKLSNNTKIEGLAYIGIPKVSYKVDMNFGLFEKQFNNVFVKADFKSNFKVDMSSENDGSISKDALINLGRVPVIGAFGSTVYLEFKLNVSAEGKATLEYNVNSQLGAQVFNNKLRAIKKISSNAGLTLEANGKAGFSIGALLEILRIWDLIDFASELGVEGEGSIIQRRDAICVDASGFVYFDLSALEDSFIAKELNIPTTWHVINKDNSPFKLYLHVENFKRVPACTYGNGTFVGTVTEAGDRTAFIKDAIIEVYNRKNVRVDEAISDENGRYKIDLKSGEYTIKISKPGYITFTTKEVLEADEEKIVETLLLVKNGSEGQVGNIGGNITDSLTGKGIGEVKLNIRSGWNNISDNIIKTIETDKNGKYRVSLPLGNYTIEMIKDGYVTKHINVYVIGKDTLDQNANLVPTASGAETGELRIVLTWGRHPYDLDSHLIGPTKDNKEFHVYYGDRRYKKDGVTYAELDLDDTSSYGPETTTVYKMNDTGKYSFYVHDYTNKKRYESNHMSNSGAKVEVYKGEVLYASYNIPTNVVGNYWHVFDYDVETNKIISVNEIGIDE